MKTNRYFPQTIVLLLILLVVAGSGLFWIHQHDEPLSNPNLSQQVIIYDPVRSIAPFLLSDQQQQAFSHSQLLGQWSIIFLGYTYCPDICPTTLAMLRSIYQSLNEVTKTHVVFVSADPNRDTPERLRQYLQYFHPEFIGVTAPHADLLPFTQNLGLAYAMYSGQTPESYLVDHSASIVLVNPQGQIQATFLPSPNPYGYVPTVDAKLLLSDFKSIVQASSYSN